MSNIRSFSPAWLAFAAGLLPLAGVMLSYWIAVDAGAVPGCNPFIDGCTSVSSTGRHFPASLIFRAAMLPEVLLAVLFWLLSYRWLQTLGASRTKGPIWMTLLGVIASIFLILYVSFLGTQGEVYSFLRRFGVSVYFGFTYLAQALIVRELWVLPHPVLRRPVRVMFVLLLAQLTLGMSSIIADLFGVQTNRVENIIEWTYALFMMLFFVVCGWAWKRSGFALHASCDQ